MLNVNGCPGASPGASPGAGLGAAQPGAAPYPCMVLMNTTFFGRFTVIGFKGFSRGEGRGKGRISFLDENEFLPIRPKSLARCSAEEDEDGVSMR